MLKNDGEDSEKHPYPKPMSETFCKMSLSEKEHYAEYLSTHDTTNNSIFQTKVSENSSFFHHHAESTLEQETPNFRIVNYEEDYSELIPNPTSFHTRLMNMDEKHKNQLVGAMTEEDYEDYDTSQTASLYGEKNFKY
jgi:hypothetical protein